jgi:hypothetical protein
MLFTQKLLSSTFDLANGDHVAVFHSAKSPLIHWGLVASANHVKRGGVGWRCNGYNPKKFEVYDSSISRTADATFGLSLICTKRDFGPTASQLIFRVLPAAILLVDPWINWPALSVLWSPNSTWRYRQSHLTFSIAEMWLLLVIVNGKVNGKAGSEAEAAIVASAS